MIFQLKPVTDNVFDREACLGLPDPPLLRFLNRFGADVRQYAMRSMHPAPRRVLMQIQRKREQLRHAAGQYAIKLLAELQTLSKEASSKPGKPPNTISGYIRNHIAYAAQAGFKLAEEGVIIGPVQLSLKSIDAPRILEHGGIARDGNITLRVRPRPSMQPAFDVIGRRIATIWNSVT